MLNIGLQITKSLYKRPRLQIALLSLCIHLLLATNPETESSGKPQVDRNVADIKFKVKWSSSQG